jgi:hypothetical protein
MDDGVPELAAAIYRERVRRAREMTIEEKLLAGGRLYDQERAIVLGRVRAILPEAADSEVQDIVTVALRWIHREGK